MSAATVRTGCGGRGASAGGGSLGGKGRGLAFANRLIEAYGVGEKLDKIEAFVPEEYWSILAELAALPRT